MRKRYDMTTRCCRAAAGLLTAAAALGLAAPGAMAQAPPPARFQFDAAPGRLSKQVVPSHYALTLDLDPARDAFDGEVSITVQVRQPVAAIELHAHELGARSARLLAGGTARPLRVDAQAQAQSWLLTPEDGAPVPPGEYRIAIAYRGRVHPADEGLFVAPYRVGGQPRRMLATQLEAIAARTLFPGFDEPAFRAVFEITVRAPADLDVASNMPRSSRSVEGERAVHRFAPTPPMPSYLVSVAAGRFDVLADRSDGVALRILTAEGKRGQARYAMAATRQLLPFYAQYFGMPYALPKLDQLAVPSVRGGAMEDWGLISYSEDRLLVDRARSSEPTRRNVYGTIAHEIAHQWFGNLVTAASWDEIWLNEAFATWMQNKATDHFNPSWKVPLEQRLPTDRAMALDAGAATRAIRSGPVTESAVNDVFDPITYAKGGAVLAMLEQWVGPQAFRNGLAAYMKGQRLSNATAGDLWHHIGRASERDVAGVAASWTDQPGFPLVQVRSACEGGHTRVTLSQSRFSIGDASTAALWKIPLRLSRGGAITTALLDRAQQTFTLDGCADAPLVVNAGGIGFYRVAYESAAWQVLIRRFGELDDADRITLLSDGFALMQAGQLPLASYFVLLDALPRVHGDSRAMLWAVAGAQLDSLDTAMAGSPARQPLRAAGIRLLAPQLARVGWVPAPTEDAQTTQWRGALIEQLARFDDAPTVRQALRAFDRHESGQAPLPASLRPAIVQAAGSHADRARFERLRVHLANASGEEERWMYAKALASARDPALAAEALAVSLGGAVPANIASAMPGLVAGNSPFGELAYRYTVDHWKPLAELAGTYGRGFLLPNAAKGFNTPEQAARLVDDQQREAGPDGAVLAAREAVNIRLRAVLKDREEAARGG